MMTPTSNAVALRCERCGDSFSAQLAPVLHCPTCGHRQAAPTVVAAASAYEHDVATYAQAAKAEAKITDFWNMSSLGSPLTNIIPMFLPLVLSVVGMAYWTFMQRSFPDLDEIWLRLIGGALLLMVIGILAWVFREQLHLTGAPTPTSTREPAPAPPVVRVACPRCGAPGALGVGEGVDQCRFCKAAMVASATVMQKGVALARAAHVRAAQTRRRAERTAMAGIGPWQTYRVRVVWVIGGPMLLFGLSRFGAAVGVLGTFSDALWGLGFVAVASVIFYVGVRGAPWERKRAAQWRKAELELCAAVPGAPCTQKQTHEWLDRNWPDDLPNTWYFEARPRARVALTVDDYAALVVIDPKAANENARRRAEVFLAAEIPGVSSGPGPAPHPRGEGSAAWNWLLQQSFSIHVGTAGLVARADDHVVARFARDPSMISGMATVVTALATIARSMGASPAAPMD